MNDLLRSLCDIVPSNFARFDRDEYFTLDSRWIIPTLHLPQRSLAGETRASHVRGAASGPLVDRYHLATHLELQLTPSQAQELGEALASAAAAYVEEARQ